MNDATGAALIVAAMFGIPLAALAWSMWRLNRP